MNLRLRWALTFFSMVLYWVIPDSFYGLWVPYLLAFILLLGLKDLSNTLTTLFILSLLLIPSQLYQVTNLSFLKSWLSPLIPLTFLFPSTTLAIQHKRTTGTRYRYWLRLSGFSTFIGNGAFQVAHGISVFLFASSRRGLHLALRSPAFFLPVLWLLTGLLVKLLHLDGIDHLSTAASWIWAPLLCLTFAALNSEQLSVYLRAIAFGLGLSSAFGVVIWLINPSIETPILNLLPFISSLHQARVPGSHDAWAATGFFFHRLKFAHLSLLLLPTLLFIPKRMVQAIVALLVITAIVLSHAAWATIVGGTLLALYVVCKLWKQPRGEVLVAGALLCTIAVHLVLLTQPNLSNTLIAKSPSLQTRQFMATQAVTQIEEQPIGLGHGGYKAWSINHYPTELNNRQLPRTLPHNLGLATLAETGIAGWTIFVALLAYLLSQSMEVLWRTRASKQAKRLALFIGSGTLTLLGLGMLHDPLYHKPVAFGWMLLLGLSHKLSSDHSI